MLDAKDYPEGTPVYSFVDHETGRTIHIDSVKLRDWVLVNLDKVEKVKIPVSQDLALEFLMDNTVTLNHVKRVAEFIHDYQRMEPLIYGYLGTETNGLPDVMLIDGHHRYVVAALAKAEFVLAHALQPSQWQEFQIQGLPDFTEDELRAIPPRGTLMH